MEHIVLTTFTDPMMGLSYEHEPVLRQLETHFGAQIEFRTVMALLVRDAHDFMTARSRAAATPRFCTGRSTGPRCGARSRGTRRALDRRSPPRLVHSGKRLIKEKK